MFLMQLEKLAYRRENAVFIRAFPAAVLEMGCLPSAAWIRQSEKEDFPPVKCVFSQETGYSFKGLLVQESTFGF